MVLDEQHCLTIVVFVEIVFVEIVFVEIVFVEIVFVEIVFVEIVVFGLYNIKSIFLL
jgi:hypothetical protein